MELAFFDHFLHFFLHVFVQFVMFLHKCVMNLHPKCNEFVQFVMSFFIE